MTMTIINGFSNYSINESGEVMNNKTGRILKGSINPAGYRMVGMTNDEGKMKNALVHRLLAFAFIPNDSEVRDCINHIDGNKLNNELSNLEWCTRAENTKHAHDTGLTEKGHKRPNRNPTSRFRGVHQASKNTWGVEFWHEGVRYSGEVCDSEVRAALEYDMVVMLNGLDRPLNRDKLELEAIFSND